MAGKSNYKVVSPVNVPERKALDMRAGDTVRVTLKLKDEKGKERLQRFEGLLIARKHGAEAGATFTLRKVLSGVGVERSFPLYSPVIDKIEVMRRAKVRRAKLYYIREKSAKEISRKMKSRGMAEFASAGVKPVMPDIKAYSKAPEAVVEETPEATPTE